MSLCKSCGMAVYWSVTALGRNVPVSIAADGSAAPTRDTDGRGINHFIDCPSRDEHKKPKTRTRRPPQGELL